MPKLDGTLGRDFTRYRFITFMWSEFKNPSKDRDGLYLVKLCDGAIHLGKFLNGAFVMDGFRYNETPEIIAQIIQTQPVELKVLNE